MSARTPLRIGRPGGKQAIVHAASSRRPPLRLHLDHVLRATLLARTVDVDVKVCARCNGRLEVRAVVTDLDVARRILDSPRALGLTSFDEGSAWSLAHD